MDRRSATESPGRGRRNVGSGGSAVASSTDFRVTAPASSQEDERQRTTEQPCACHGRDRQEPGWRSPTGRWGAVLSGGDGSLGAGQVAGQTRIVGSELLDSAEPGRRPTVVVAVVVVDRLIVEHG